MKETDLNSAPWEFFAFPKGLGSASRSAWSSPRIIIARARTLEAGERWARLAQARAGEGKLGVAHESLQGRRDLT